MSKRPLDERTAEVLDRLVNVIDIESKKMLKLSKESPDKLVSDATLRIPEVLRALITLQKFNTDDEKRDEADNLSADDAALLEEFARKRGWTINKGSSEQ
jgi:hypothetical protein